MSKRSNEMRTTDKTYNNNIIVPGKFSQCCDEGDILIHNFVACTFWQPNPKRFFFIFLFFIATRRTLLTIPLTTIQENDNNENDNNTNY